MEATRTGRARPLPTAGPLALQPTQPPGRESARPRMRRAGDTRLQRAFGVPPVGRPLALPC